MRARRLRDELDDAARQDDLQEAHAARHAPELGVRLEGLGRQRREARLEREGDDAAAVRLHGPAQRREHGHAAVLELGRAEPLHGRRRRELAEARGVPHDAARLRADADLRRAERGPRRPRRGRLQRRRAREAQGQTPGHLDLRAASPLPLARPRRRLLSSPPRARGRRHEAAPAGRSSTAPPVRRSSKSRSGPAAGLRAAPSSFFEQRTVPPDADDAKLLPRD